MKRFGIAFFICLLVLAAQSSFAQLSGDYVIGTGNTYTTLTAAISALNTNGASGPVNFLINENLTEAAAGLVITRSDLTSGTLLTIKPNTGKQPVITVNTCTATAGATQYACITLNAASYVTFDGSNNGSASRDMTIKINDGTNGRIHITLYGNCDNVTIKNCKLTIQAISTTGANNAPVYVNGQATGSADNLLIENNEMGDGGTNINYYGARVTGNASVYATGVIVRNNIIYAQMRSVYYYLVGSGTTTSEITGNTIYTGSSSISGYVVYGILMNTYAGTVNITGNVFSSVKSNNASAQGLYGISTMSGSTPTLNITNNAFMNFQCLNATSNTMPVYGIYFQDGPTVTMYHNSISMSPVNNTTAAVAAMRIGGAATVTAKNNIFSNSYNTATSYAVYQAAGTLTSDYNNLYVSGASAKYGYAGGADKTAFADWQESGARDANGKGTDPKFTNATSALQLQRASGCRDAGATGLSVTTDITSYTRDATPDMGAYEYQTTTISSDGAIHGTYGDLTINANVTLDGNLSASYMSIGDGKSVTVGAYTLTLGAAPGGTGTLSAGATSSITFAGSDVAATLPLTITELNNLSIDYVNGVMLADALTIHGTLTLTNGTLTNGSNLTMASGATISRSSTGLLGSAPTYAGTINLAYTGSADVAADVEYSTIPETTTGTVLNDLTLNCGGKNFTTAYGRRINGTLYLTSGVHNSGGNIYLAPGATISRTGGSIGTALAAASAPDYNNDFSVVYPGTSLTTGNEIHSLNAPCNNITITGGPTITLGQSDTINGSLTNTNSTIAVGANTLAMYGDMSVTNGLASASSSNGRFVCLGSGRAFTLGAGATLRVTANQTQTPAATNSFDYQFNGFSTYSFSSSSWISFRNPTTSAVTMGIGKPGDGSAYQNIELAVVYSTSVNTIYDFIDNVSVAGNLAFPMLSATPALTVNLNSYTLKVAGAIQLNGVNTNSANGTRTYNYNTSTVELNGSAAQVIGGSYLPQAFYNLTTNNGGNGVTMNSAITVNNTLALTSGSVTTGAYTLTLGSAGTVSGEAAGNYVVGTLTTAKAVGTGASTFGGIGVALDAGADDLGTVTVTRVSGSAGIVTANGNTGIARKWALSSTNPPAAGRNLSLSWISSEDNDRDMNTAVVYQSTDAGTTWAPLGGSQNVSSTHTATVQTTSFTSYTVTDMSHPLPVQMVAFTATAERTNAFLQWTTATETDNASFEVERRLIGANDWAKVGAVAGAGTSTEKHEYAYADRNVMPGKYAYRLKQIDRSGKGTYSNAVEVEVIGMPHEFVLFNNYPNPFNPSTKIEFTVKEDGPAVLRVYDMLGREVATLFNGQAKAGMLNQVTFNASKLSSGVYLYTLQAGNQRTVRKMNLIK